MHKTLIITSLCLVILGCCSGRKPTRVVPEVDIASQKFVNDPEVIGTWRAVDFVKSIKHFSPDKKSWQGPLMYDEFVFKPNGKTHKPYITWTKGRVFHSGDKSEAKYTIKTINGKPYLFLEHISGDVLLRGQKPCYYVFVKEVGNVN